MTDLNRNTFWLVWRENGGVPTYPHWTKSSALTEAERLAKLTPGEVFFVLKSTAGVISDEPNVRRIKLEADPIPF